MMMFAMKMTKLFLILTFLISSGFTSPCFSPVSETRQCSCQENILELIDLAKEEINVSIYSFTDGVISQRLVNAHKKGIKVTVIYDHNHSYGKYSMIKKLKKAGIKTASSKATNHNKYIIIDDKYLLTGSYNFTKNALLRNSENCVVLEDAATIHHYRQHFKEHFYKLAGEGPDIPSNP